VPQVGYCDQLTAYLSKFLIADAATSPAAAATSEAVTIDGYKVGASVITPCLISASSWQH
jgi:hypothetical protein